MATVDLVMPKMGESIMEATILKWHKNPGDAVKMDETVLEIATDKVDTEVPSTAEGVMAELLYQVNDVVPVGTVIARIKTGAAEEASPASPQPSPPSREQQQLVNGMQEHHAPVETIHQPGLQEKSSNLNGNRFYSPLVLNIAAQEGISLTELEAIYGTGNE